MTLTLTGVSGLSVDTAAARLPAGTVTVSSDGPARVTFLRLARGTRVLQAGRTLATAGASGTAAVALVKGASILVLAPPPPRMSCTRPTGRLTGRALGLVRLGLPRTAVRRLFPRFATRGRRSMDYFCPAHHGIRVGYRRGRVALILTSDPHFVLRGVRAGTRTASAAVRRLHLRRGYRIGANTWYLVAAGASRGVLKVRHGEVQEIGIALRSATARRRRARRFLSSFG